MTTPPRLRLRRVARFISAVACEFAVPDPVQKVLKVCRSFYECFLVVGLDERVAIYRELDEVSATDEAELVELVHAKWVEQLPPDCPLPADARRLAEQFVKGLRAAKAAAAGGKDPGEALRNSLNTNLLHGPKLDAPKLDAAQKSIGRLLFASRLEALDKPPVKLGVADAPVLPDYTFLKGLGSGGFGTVFLARHEPTDTLRAVKVGPLTDPARFKQEVELARRLNSPHLVKYFESGEQGGRFWIAMEYLGDTTLADLMARPDFRARPFLLPQIGEQLLAGLADLHAAGMIHRDLKSANVMVDDQFRLKLIDFGLAKPVDKLHGYASTTTGTLIGTALYMSTEQMKGKKDLTPASDVYSAGTLVYEMFVGHPPHQADNFADVVLKAYTEAIPFDLPALPAELRPFLEYCLKREAGDRFPDGRAALDAFRGPAREAGRRLRHDHYKSAWVPVLERNLLETFSADNLGVLPEDAVEQFRQLAQTHALPECDAERLAEILPPVFAAQHKVRVSEEAVIEAKQRFAREAINLNADQMRERTEDIRRLEAAVSAAHARVTSEVHRLLADEVATWESLVEAKRKAEATAEAKRQEEIRQQAEKELSRKQAEEQQKQREQEELARQARAEQERIQLEASVRASQQLRLLYVAVAAIVGSFALGSIGALLGWAGFTTICNIVAGLIAGAIGGFVCAVIVGGIAIAISQNETFGTIVGVIVWIWAVVKVVSSCYEDGFFGKSVSGDPLIPGIICGVIGLIAGGIAGLSLYNGRQE